METERIVVFRTRASAATRWCEQCEMEVEMMFVDAASIVSGLTEMSIYHLIETRSVHFADGEWGRVLVCLNSLLK